jgi:hypothetical protein
VQEIKGLQRRRSNDATIAQIRGYGIGIAAEFVRQLPKTSSNQYRICTTGKSGPGGS